MTRFLALFLPLMLAGCSVFGKQTVESAPYTLLKAAPEQNIEVRNYEAMVLVSTPMNSGTGSAFRRLFNYIAGANQGSQEIAMTAPVFMNNESDAGGQEIAMTAPVLMGRTNGEPQMSFVMPSDFTLATTPTPTDPLVSVSEVTDYRVAAIKFNWTLSESNVRKHTEILENWLAENGYEAAGPAIEAAYNDPFTLPMFRHNEILIPVK